MDLADYFPFYPEQDDPNLVNFLSSSKEFVDLASSKDEPIPQRGEFFKHQLATLRLLREYNYLIMMDEPGTGKTGKIQAYTEWARREFRKDPYAAINGALILVPGKNTRLEFVRQLFYKSNTGDLEKELKLKPGELASSKGMMRVLRQEGFYQVTHYKKFVNVLARMSNQQIRETYSNKTIFMDEIHTLHIDINDYVKILALGKLEQAFPTFLTKVKKVGPLVPSGEQEGGKKVGAPLVPPSPLPKGEEVKKGTQKGEKEKKKKEISSPTNAQIFYHLLRLRQNVVGSQFIGASATLMGKLITDMIPMTQLFHPEDIPPLPYPLRVGQEEITYNELYQRSANYYFQDLEIYPLTRFPYNKTNAFYSAFSSNIRTFNKMIANVLPIYPRDTSELERIAGKPNNDVEWMTQLLNYVNEKYPILPNYRKQENPERLRNRVLLLKDLLSRLSFPTGNQEKYNVLDLGCSQGEFLREVKKEFPQWNLYGTDIIPPTSVNTGNVFEYDELDQNTGQYPYGDDSFDLVILNVSFHHIMDKRNLASLKRITKVGGYIILREHNVESQETANYLHLIHAIYEVIGDRKNVNQFMADYQTNYLSEGEIDTIFLSPPSYSGKMEEKGRENLYFIKVFRGDVNFNLEKPPENPQKLYYVAYQKIRDYDITDYATTILAPYLQGYFTYVRSLETKAKQEVVTNNNDPDDLKRRFYLDNPLTREEQHISAYDLEIVDEQQKNLMVELYRQGGDEFSRNKSEVGSFLLPGGGHSAQDFDRIFILPSQEGRIQKQGDNYYHVKPEYQAEMIKTYQRFYRPYPTNPISKVTMAAHLVATCSLSSFFPPDSVNLAGKKGCCFVFSERVRGSDSVYVVAECLRLIYQYEPFTGRSSGIPLLSQPPKWRYAVITGDSTIQQVSNILDLMYHSENVFGDYLQCVIVTEAAEQSISFPHIVRGILVTTQATEGEIKQIVMRYLRATSHDELLKKLGVSTIPVELYPLVSYLYTPSSYTTSSAPFYDSSRGGVIERGGDKELVSPDITQLRRARENSFYTSLQERVIVRLTVNCRIDYSRNQVSPTYQSTLTCNYTSCQYQCFCANCPFRKSPLLTPEGPLLTTVSPDLPGPLLMSSDINKDNYDALYLDSNLETIIQRVVAELRNRPILPLKDLTNVFRPKELVYALDNMVLRRLTAKDKWGRTVFISRAGEYAYLSLQIPAVSKPENTYYLENLVGYLPPTEIKVFNSERLAPVRLSNIERMLQGGMKTEQYYLDNIRREIPDTEEQTQLVETAVARVFQGNWPNRILLRRDNKELVASQPEIPLEQYTNTNRIWVVLSPAGEAEIRNDPYLHNCWIIAKISQWGYWIFDYYPDLYIEKIVNFNKPKPGKRNVGAPNKNPHFTNAVRLDPSDPFDITKMENWYSTKTQYCIINRTNSFLQKGANLAQIYFNVVYSTEQKLAKPDREEAPIERFRAAIFSVPTSGLGQAPLPDPTSQSLMRTVPHSTQASNGGQGIVFTTIPSQYVRKCLYHMYQTRVQAGFHKFSEQAKTYSPNSGTWLHRLVDGVLRVVVPSEDGKINPGRNYATATDDMLLSIFKLAYDLHLYWDRPDYPKVVEEIRKRDPSVLRQDLRFLDYNSPMEYLVYYAYLRTYFSGMTNILKNNDLFIQDLTREAGRRGLYYDILLYLD